MLLGWPAMYFASAELTAPLITTLGLVIALGLLVILCMLACQLRS